MSREYRSAPAFKQALELRLRASSETSAALARQRQLLIFDRCLARIVAELGDAVMLKGGLALELRLERARSTKDVDLRVMGSDPDNLLEQLQAAMRHDLGDFLSFTVRPDHRHPNIQGDGVRYDGVRFRVECQLAGKVYGRPFGLDVAFGDPVTGSPERLVANDTLSFAGIAPPTLRVYPIETHLAEKLHAYTMPRDHPNSRVKDLPDMALIATAHVIESEVLRAAITQTFSFRDTHSIPTQLPAPPVSWAAPYESLAREELLSWSTLTEVTEAASSFLDPALAADLLGCRWCPTRWSWMRA